MNIVRKLQYYHIIQYVFLILIFALACSCKISKHVPDNDFLIKNVEINLNSQSTDSIIDFIDPDEMYVLIKQKPNRKLLSKFRFYLRLFNLSNQQRINKRILVKQQKNNLVNNKIELKNKRKLARDSSSKTKSFKQRSLTFGEKIQRAGESPVILNELLSKRSITQLGNFLFNKGCFDSEINDSVIYHGDKEVTIQYNIKTGPLSKINNISYECFDSVINQYLDTIKQNSLIKESSHFDTYLLSEERNNVTAFLQNRGFYSFNKEFIFYDLDTNGINGDVNLTFGIQNYKKFNNSINEFTELPHQQFTINRVFVRINSSLNLENEFCLDTFRTKNLEILNCQPIKYQKRILRNSILLKKNQFYKKVDAQKTYKRLIGLDLFKSVNLSFDTLNKTQLNAFVNLVPSKTQSFGVSIDGTNSDGVYGTEGSISYAHNNLFHGGEKFLFSLRGGLETQLLYSDTINSNNTFNTLEIGPEFHFIIPKYFLINKIKRFKSHSNAKTEITGTVNYQKRPDFERWNQELSFGWIFHEKKQITWHITPLLVSAVDIDLDPLYQTQIESLNDQFIATSFLDHIIAGGLFSFEYNGQNINANKSEFYAKATVEAAGGTLYRFHELTGKPKDSQTDTYYDLFNIRYSHFQKFSLDLRYYQPLFYKSKLVYRVFAGLGIPKSNQIKALPFEKSFFSGGSNGMRAWKVRSLGPGGFLDTSNRFDKIGDIKLEGNIESRFPISEWIEGALFLDMGNVWLLRYDSLRAAGQFKWDSFLDQIAFGGGFGLRINLDFFIIRADIAIPIKNPAIPYNDSNNNLSSAWIFDDKFKNRKQYHPLQFNLGIGYPF